MGVRAGIFRKTARGRKLADIAAAPFKRIPPVNAEE